MTCEWIAMIHFCISMGDSASRRHVVPAVSTRKQPARSVNDVRVEGLRSITCLRPARPRSAYASCELWKYSSRPSSSTKYRRWKPLNEWFAALRR